MEWIERMNAVVNFIEEHIAEDLDFGEIARIACVSVYHFQRMFVVMAGMPLSEYVRRRRMSLAVADIKAAEKVVDVALKYGYNSPTAFNRAFKSVHGVAPSLVKHDGVVVKSYPPIRFAVTIKGAEGLDYRIEKRDAFRIVGVSVLLEKGEENGSELMEQLWDVAAGNGTLATLATMMDGKPAGSLSVMVCDDRIEEWRCYAAVASSQEISGNLEEYVVPAYTWAIFSGEGKYPDVVGALWERVLGEWLPTSGYEYDNGPDMEVYIDESDLQNCKFEIWLPVRRGCAK